MDCETARLYCHFNRPRAGELDSAETAALEAHLTCCPECAALARAEQRLDQHLGRAMRNVDVPEGLRTQLLARLAAQRGDRHRRRAAFAARIVAAAAVLLLAVGGWWHWWYPHTLPPFPAQEAFDEANLHRPGDAGDVEDDFKRMGVTARVPAGLNYAYLSNVALAELPGKPGKVVPQLLFRRTVGGRSYEAKVYVVSNRDFNLESITDTPQIEMPGYKYKYAGQRAEDRRYAYLFFYTGPDLDWLRAGPAARR
jgi:hypothetical protein